LRCLQFLQADHVRLRSPQPRDQIGQALVDIVDVEGGDLHSGIAGAANGSVPCVEWW